MIKKLRIKLIFAAMLSLFLVLFIIMAAVSVLNYRNIISDADETLAFLAKNNGEFPIRDFFAPQAPQKDDFRKKDPFSSPEMPYETRYFSVSFNPDGEVSDINTGNIAAVDESSAVRYASEVAEKGSRQGFIGDYRFLAEETDSGLLVLFLDCSRSLDSFRTFLAISVTVSSAGFILVLLLITFLSGYIIKPFSQNYEKQKRFITDAGHELKTPLTIINADAEILEMDFGENEWIHDIKTQTKRLSDLTNDLVMLSRTEESGDKSTMLDFPVSDVAEETVNSFQSIIKTQNKTLKVDIQPMISMYGDEKAIRKLLSILLDNAIKYSLPQSEISFTLEKRKNQIKISVFNKTEFISKKQIVSLFDRFYRTDHSRNSETGGYGLGLSIAAAIVNSHKGKITASTEDEKSLLITALFTV